MKNTVKIFFYIYFVITLPIIYWVYFVDSSDKFYWFIKFDSDRNEVQNYMIERQKKFQPMNDSLVADYDRNHDKKNYLYHSVPSVFEDEFFKHHLHEKFYFQKIQKIGEYYSDAFYYLGVANFLLIFIFPYLIRRLKFEMNTAFYYCSIALFIGYSIFIIVFLIVVLFLFIIFSGPNF